MITKYTIRNIPVVYDVDQTTTVNGMKRKERLTKNENRTPYQDNFLSFNVSNLVNFSNKFNYFFQVFPNSNSSLISFKLKSLKVK